MNGLFSDLIPSILLRLKFFEQHRLAKVCKLFYNYYCIYKKGLYENDLIRFTECVQEGESKYEK